MNLKSNKAITLIALIITIIILLILAGVSLSIVLGENGLINKAQSSVNKYKESSENEQKLLNSIENYMDLQLKLPGEKVDLPDGWNKDTVDAVLDDKKNTIPVPKNFYYVGGNLDNGVIISDNSADAYDGKVDKTTWEYTTSLVGNQFVWIPCTESEYHKTEWESQSQYVYGVYDKSGPSQDEIDKVKKYNGFYVGRYEAGLADTIKEYTGNQLSDGSNSPGYNVEGIPNSKAEKLPWIFISQTNSKANAENMYKNNSCVTSGLITGTQWDVMLNKFIGTTNANRVTFTEADMKNSSKWGNCYNNDLIYTGRSATLFKNGSSEYISPWGEKQINAETKTNTCTEYTTGASKATESYHIYDVAGNVWEWTEEIGQGTAYRVIRGGSCGNDQDTSPACCRYSTLKDYEVYYHIGFRTVLYIKN